MEAATWGGETLKARHPDAIGMVYGIPVIIGPATSFTCADGTILTPP